MEGPGKTKKKDLPRSTQIIILQSFDKSMTAIERGQEETCSHKGARHKGEQDKKIKKVKKYMRELQMEELKIKMG